MGKEERRKAGPTIMLSVEQTILVNMLPQTVT